MPFTLAAEQSITVGHPVVVEGPSPQAAFGIVFEDDGTTGYLYALDFSRDDDPIVDAMQIYSVSQVVDSHEPSVVQLVWSQDGLKGALIINRYPHAIFDFEARRGYCRTGFPSSDGKWTQYDHNWDEKAIDLFR